ncbi:MAG: dephospho-CoA kinase, partial [Chloroflexota bacterium]|nr:dephospho-CoA kinase [Chloroflexota bacterium]
KIEETILHYNEGVIVVEAIKLLETGLSDHCDSVWVVNASFKKRLERLTERDNINIEEAHNRLYMQGSQELKLKQADVIIENDGPLETTYAQIWREWGKIGLPK